MYNRGFKYPYGWIKESGTPPEPHCDCMLISNEHFELGDEVDVKIIRMFKRTDGDHKYIVSKSDSKCDDYEQLSAEEREALKRLYPRIGKGEGWFGKEEALYCDDNCERAL